MGGPQKHRTSVMASLGPHLQLDRDFWARIEAVPWPDVASAPHLGTAHQGNQATSSVKPARYSFSKNDTLWLETKPVNRG